MKKYKSLPVIVVGACLIFISLSLVIGFHISMQAGIQRCKNITTEIREILPKGSAGAHGSYPNSTMPVLEINGTDYVALLEVPAFDITLPVADQWDSHRMIFSPARFYGSVYDSTIIIGGADNPDYFGFADSIDLGSVVVITDMTGSRFFYTVSEVNRAKNAQTQWLSETDSDLTLFCRDIHTLDYIAVRCDLSYNE